MKLRHILCALCVLNTGIYADDLEAKKAELERQIQELESKQQKQNEIDELEKRLQNLKSSQTPTQESQPTQPQQTANTPIQQPKTIKDEDYRNGFFIGIGVGGMGSKFGHRTPDFEATYVAPSVRLGYQKFAQKDSIFGTRLSIDYAYGAPVENTQSDPSVGYSETIRADQGYLALNLDFLFEMRAPSLPDLSAGLVLGVGYGRINHNATLSWTQEEWLGTTSGEDWQKLGMPTPFINVGAGITYKKHRLEAYAKIPTTDKYTEKFYYEVSDPLMSVVYQYTF